MSQHQRSTQEAPYPEPHPSQPLAQLIVKLCGSLEQLVIHDPETWAESEIPDMQKHVLRRMGMESNGTIAMWHFHSESCDVQRPVRDLVGSFKLRELRTDAICVHTHQREDPLPLQQPPQQQQQQVQVTAPTQGPAIQPDAAEGGSSAATVPKGPVADVGGPAARHRPKRGVTERPTTQSEAVDDRKASSRR